MQAVLACGARSVRLIVDLTSTHRYYEPAELPVGIRHLKLPVVGGAPPAEACVDHAVEVIRQLREQYGGYEHAIALVHCTHGLNRTGFFVVSVLVKLDGYTLN